MTLKRVSIGENASSIVINPQILRHSTTTTGKRLPHHLQRRRPGASLRLILEAVESESPASSRKESQFPIADDFHAFLADFPLTSPATVIAASAEAEVLATHLHILLDATVTLAVQDSGIAHVGSSGHDE